VWARSTSARARRTCAGCYDASKPEKKSSSRKGKPVARLVAVERPARRIFGSDRGAFEVLDEFDAALPQEVLREFGA
jgi:hypothetical protein